MSTPAPSSPSLHPTRRQLDELHALMERMLELPVNPSAEEAKSAATEAPLAEPVGAAPFAECFPNGAGSYHTEESDPSPDESQRAFAFTSSDPASKDSGAPAAEGQSHSPFAWAAPTSLRSNSGRPGENAWSPPGRGAADNGPPAPIWLWPVVGINQIYDTLMGGVGGPGRIMRGTGRAWLGWIGLLMLAAALAWGVFDWIQWTG